MVERNRTASIIAVVSFFLSLATSAFAESRITKLNVESRDAGTDVVISFNGEVTAKHFSLETPPREVLDMWDVKCEESLKKVITVNDALVYQVRLVQYRPRIVRLVVHLKRKAQGEITKGDGSLVLKLAERGKAGVDQAFLKWKKKELKEEIRKVYLEGKKWFKKRDYEKAALEFEKVLKMDPDHQEATAYLKRIEREKERTIKEEALRRKEEEELTEKTARELAAREALKRAEGIVHKKGVAEEVIAVPVSPREEKKLLAMKKNKEIAISKGESLLVEREDEINRHLALGIALYHERRFVEAGAEFDVVLELDPACKDAQEYKEASTKRTKERRVFAEKRGERLITKAMWQEEENNWEGSMRTWKEILALNPDSKLAEKGIEKARLKLEAFAQSPEVEAKRRYVLAKRSYREGRYGEAVVECERALALDPGLPGIGALLVKATRLHLYDEKKKATIDKQRSLGDALLDVTKIYSLPRREKGVKANEEIVAPGPTKRTIEDKVKINIKKIDFSSIHIRDAINYLVDVSDVNIVLDDRVFPKGATAPPGGGVDVFEEGGEGAVASEAMITLRLRNVPLIEALKLILETKGLNYAIEPNYIYVFDAKYEKRVTKTYTLKYGIRRIEKTSPMTPAPEVAPEF